MLECQGLATNRVTLRLKLVKGGSHHARWNSPFLCATYK